MAIKKLWEGKRLGKAAAMQERGEPALPAHPCPQQQPGGALPQRGTCHGAAHHMLRPTPSRAASASASPAPLGRCCCPWERGQSSAPTSPAELAATRTLSAGSGGAVGPWGCDPASALGTLWLHGSTCAKHYRCIAEPMVRAGNATQAGEKRFAMGTASCHLARGTVFRWEEDML